jgi:hypothetical protein
MLRNAAPGGDETPEDVAMGCYRGSVFFKRPVLSARRWTRHYCGRRRSSERTAVCTTSLVGGGCSCE